MKHVWMVLVLDLITPALVLVMDNVLESVLQDNISTAHPAVPNVLNHQLDKLYVCKQVLDAVLSAEPSLLVMLHARLVLAQLTGLVLLAILDSF